jgi:hypothetical protein
MNVSHAAYSMSATTYALTRLNTALDLLYITFLAFWPSPHSVETVCACVESDKEEETEITEAPSSGEGGKSKWLERIAESVEEDGRGSKRFSCFCFFTSILGEA